MSIDIKVLNWNVRGLNCAARRETVKIIIRQAGRNIICLRETKLDSVSNLMALEFLGQTCMSYEFLDADSTRGGILVAWNRDLIQAETPTRKEFTLSLKLTMKLSDVSFTRSLQSMGQQMKT